MTAMLHRTALALTCMIVLSMIAAAPADASRAKQAISNPVLPSGPDPWIVRHGDTYFYMNTLGNRLAIRKTKDLARLLEATETVVWTPPNTGPNAQSIWAPELHRIGNAWYIYYTAAESGHDDDAHRGIFVLENRGDDPLRGEWTDRGRLNTAYTGIDGTTFAYAGKRYFAYSPYVGQDSELAIVEMANPWTLTGKESIVARPDLAWERRGGRQILEGPEFLAGPKGDLFLSYSASACWSDDYAIGLLSARRGSDPLDPAVWTKTPHPVIAKAPDQNVFAPGHNGFFTSPDGKTWIVYHANPGPDMKCTGQRAPRIQHVKWSTLGTPVFDRPTGSPPAGHRGRIPVEKDADRHLAFLVTKDRLIKTGGTGLVFVGDSITDWWRNDPQRKIFEDYFGRFRPYNIGIAGDETQHVLWRIGHGELDGLAPKLVVLMIGTNNLANGSKMSPAETADGVAAVVEAIRRKLPTSKILLLGIFPRANRSDDPLRLAVNATNKLIAGLQDRKTVFYRDIGGQFLSPDGTLPGDLMPDYLHPNAKGYQIWADAIKVEVDRMMGVR